MPDRPRPRDASARAFIAALARRLDCDRVSGLAAEVSYFGILSLFPSLLVAASALSELEHIVGGDLARRSHQQVIEFMQTFMTDRADPVVRAVSELFTEGGGGVVTTAVALSVWTMSMGFMAVISALDRVYGLAERRSWWKQRLTAIALALGSVLVLAVMLALVVLGPFLGTGVSLAERAGLGGAFTFVWGWLRAPFAFVLLILWAATLYTLAPGERRPWRSSLPGALVAAGGWLAGSYGLKLYVWLAAEANRVLVAVGGGLLLLVWVYILSFVLLLGAEVNDLLARRRRG